MVLSGLSALFNQRRPPYSCLRVAALKIPAHGGRHLSKTPCGVQHVLQDPYGGAHARAVPQCYQRLKVYRVDADTSRPDDSIVATVIDRYRWVCESADRGALWATADV
jgi:hypothetical protein